jgi:DNA-binding ferritin-like protein
MLKAYAPYRLTDFFDLSTVGEPVITGDPQPMLIDLCSELENHIMKLKEAGILATSLGEFGLANFFADRQTASQKWCWQVMASIEVETD